MRYLLLPFLLQSLLFIGSSEELTKPKTESFNWSVQDEDISGYYSIVGEDYDKEYTGMVMITRTKSVYTLVYILSNGLTMTGIGQQNKDCLSVGWRDGSEKVMGNTFYVRNGKTWEGHWISLPGNGLMNRETLTFVKSIKDIRSKF